jgi:hypothetical protein
MKKISIVVAAVMACAVVTYAALDASRLQSVVLVAPTDVAIATNQTFSAVDKMPFTGVAGVVVVLGANTGAVANVKLQSSATGTNGWADIAGASANVTGTNGVVATIPYDTTGGSRYIRVSVTNSTAVAPITVILNSYK